MIEVTNGNPLLIELGVDLLIKGEPLGTLTKADILDSRAVVVLEKLRQQGFSDKGLFAIAVATLADGPKLENWYQVLQDYVPNEDMPTLSTLIDAFPYSRKAPVLVRYQRNTRSDEFKENPPRVPVLRPDLIADQVINRVVSAQGEVIGKENAEKLVAAAWRANNPGGTLRTQTRRLQEGNSLIGDAFNRPLSASDFKSSLDYLQASMDLTIRYGGALEIALSAIDGSTSADLLASLPIIRAVMSSKDSRFKPMLRVLAKIVTRLAKERADGSEQFSDIIGLVALAFERPPMQPAISWFADEAALVGEAVVSCVAKYGDILLQKENRESQLELADAVSDHGVDAVHILKPLIDVLKDHQWPDKPGMLADWMNLRNHLTRAMVWVADDDDRTEVEARASAMTTEGNHYPQDSDVQREIARAWSHVAYAHGQIPEGGGAEAAAQHARAVDAIAEPFPEHAGIQESRAVAWRYVADAHGQIPEGVGAEAAAQDARAVDAIAEPFPEHAGIQESRAVAWRHVAYAHGQIPEGAGAEAAAQDARAVDAIAEPFPEHAGIQVQRAGAWSYIAFAHCQIPRGAGAEAADRCARAVDAIARLFPENTSIQEERELAWQYASKSRNQDC